ncbi:MULTISPECIES: hypothetical protein [Staphylococcus]|uniref:hypothetical protein n=1 Tax=Staphylococcus TaxID=1279 RepID=UPI0001CC5C41|nr:hypothetical protein [Staphylococcus epidermidis]EFE60028.1 hypothetical protein HMPREF0794_0168 [Staphylococcus epidermidis M23864:W2(grey)]EJD87634.1 hypothetical protein HMPREF9991_02783 [Staphylococcus epidermidis NIHLM067]MBE9421014.1 hypothetical protein [Staphylococcus epidermidis]MBV5131878.1 hypothetical protein [Staphylococcus epidermidis]MBV5158298.1 hypothetical protein [Staphylococcus epidermidis]
MNVYLVSYDLNNPGQKYSKLYELIKQFPDYIHFQDSVWIIKAVENSTFIYDYLSSALDKGDHILIIKVTRDFFGISSEENWKKLAKFI